MIYCTKCGKERGEEFNVTHCSPTEHNYVFIPESSEVQDLREVVAKFEEEIARNILEYNADVGRIATERDKYRGALERTHSRLQANCALVDTETQAAIWMVEIEKLKAENEKLKAESAGLNTTIRSLVNQRINLNCARVNLKKQNKEVRQANEKLRAEVKELWGCIHTKTVDMPKPTPTGLVAKLTRGTSDSVFKIGRDEVAKERFVEKLKAARDLAEGMGIRIRTPKDVMFCSSSETETGFVVTEQIPFEGNVELRDDGSFAVVPVGLFPENSHNFRIEYTYFKAKDNPSKPRMATKEVNIKDHEYGYAFAEHPNGMTQHHIWLPTKFSNFHILYDVPEEEK